MARYFTTSFCGDDESGDIYGSVTNEKITIIRISYGSACNSLPSATIESFPKNHSRYSSYKQCFDTKEHYCTEEKFDEIKNQVIAMLYEPPEL